MKLASLYSGGKDSSFATYLATEMGHEIVCLVNIVSGEKASWMFHTPNVSYVPAMAEAMDLPLIVANSDGSEDDDIRVLKEVLSDLDIDGVVTGAIWSDYQWERINAVCGELNLFVLSPLWRKDQNIVYDEMVNAGIDAIIVGTYAEGLDGEWLGRHLDTETKKELLQLNKRYGVSIMGEGGEYESLTLDSPMFLRPLKINKSQKEETSSTSLLNVTELD